MYHKLHSAVNRESLKGNALCPFPLKAAAESITQRLEENPFDADSRTLQLGELSETLIVSANTQGLTGEAHFLFYKNGMANAEARIATSMLNKSNDIPVSLIPDQLDERFEGDLETVDRFIHDEKNALSPTQKQKLTGAVEQARRAREERRSEAVGTATKEAKAASLNYRLGKVPYADAARLAEMLPPYERAALETQLDDHRRVLLAADYDAGVLKANEAKFKEARRAWKSQFDQTMILGGMLDEKKGYVPLSIEERLSLATDAALKHFITPTEHKDIRERMIELAKGDNEAIIRQCAEIISKDYYKVMDVKGGAASLKKDVAPNQKLVEYTVKKNPFREDMTKEERVAQYEKAAKNMPVLKGIGHGLYALATPWRDEFSELAEEIEFHEMSNQMAVDLLNQVVEYANLSIQEKKTRHGEKPPTPVEFFKSMYEPKEREMIQRTMVDRMSKRSAEMTNLRRGLYERTFQAPASAPGEKE